MLDAFADADHAHEAGRHPQPRNARKRAGGPDHRFIFKDDRAASARDAVAPAANLGKRNTVLRGDGHARQRQYPAMRGGGAVIAGSRSLPLPLSTSARPHGWRVANGDPP